MTQHGAHLDDDILFELHRPPGPSGVPTPAETHAGECEPCGERLAELRRTAVRTRELLAIARAPDTAVTEHAARFRQVAASLSRSVAHRRQRRYTLVAAAVPLALLGLSSVEPVRGWVAKQLRDAVAPASVPALPARDTPVPSPTATLAFVPAQERLTVEVDHRQIDGELTVRTSAGSEASMQLLDMTPGDDVLVTSTGFRVRNSADSRGSYVVTVPRLVTSVALTIGGTGERVVPASELASGEVRVSLVVR